ncbi:glutamyl-tRNA(Gln) amidotransferase subunit A, mitochondrial isoform X1 [Schistocerca piceifrons]|uniref:glutamyl-tRNA(Gln) amidotransferase subunit A, mitochondrial isoform X1 n=1 Tax=Schistocerca piceifrons TaxID=274613 RepID=UPI001F5EA340|nr:glutamyl-tRNA(Gln) amidotransferase subunit A, mitochondrial isoform X1 [Schistocerca piceifrons]XP_047114441.1 glutamyl-tRNA(Gln) amidotransferase subunit A, mitochondrial isoform X1 [Schistocerca piceifrons]
MLSLSIRQVSQFLRDGLLLPSSLCEECLARSRRIEELNAFIRIEEKLARAQASESNIRYKDGCPQGSLDGVPVAVKDNFCTKNIKTTCASRMLQDFCPSYDATVVRKLKESGAILLGKCNMDEFAMGCGTVDSLYGPTKNIWLSRFQGVKNTQDNPLQHEEFDSGDHASFKKQRIREFHTVSTLTHAAGGGDDWHIAGGSSGGSAVAVASGAVFAALGSDTGGSVRNPAAYCGIVGFKPTYGLLSRYGLIPLVNSMDVPGILTRTVDDAVTMFNILAGHDPMDSTTVRKPFSPIFLPKDLDVKGLRVGVPAEYHCPGLSTEVLAAWTEVADLLEHNGAVVSQVSLPHTQLSIACYSVLNHTEVASNMARYDGIEYGYRANESNSAEALFAASRRSGFGEVVRSRILSGNYFLLRRNYNKYFVQALKLRRLIAQDFEQVWSLGVDVLLTPVTMTDAPRHSEFVKLDNRQQCSSQDYCTQPANLAGLPAISVPVKLSKNGLPLSLQLMAPMFKEDTLFRTAKWIEESLKFPAAELAM